MRRKYARVLADASLRAVSAWRACPEYEVIPRVSEVRVNHEVPGAASQNTELWWDDELHTLSLGVTLSAEGKAASYAAPLCA